MTHKQRIKLQDKYSKTVFNIGSKKVHKAAESHIDREIRKLLFEANRGLKK